MKARIGGREIEVDEGKVGSGVDGTRTERHTLRGSATAASSGGTVKARQPVALEPVTKPACQPLYRSKLERQFAQHLDAQRHGGQIAQWWFEPLKFNLAPKTTYTPDFLVLAGDGLTFYEIKGFMRDDAAVKVKVAAAMNPWAKFVLVKRRKGQWHEKTVG